MADDISVVISAQIGDLTSALSEATNAIKNFTENVQGGFKNAGQGGEEFQHKMEKALDAGIFLEYEEIAKQALEVLQEAFEKTAGKAMEFGLETSKFAAMMGSSTEHAAGLSAALNSVGVSLQEYEQLAMRMEMRLKTQEGAFNSLGMATRDSSGALMQGEALMQSAIATMQQYKVGTDQNEFALQVFGRRAQDIYDIMRANRVEQQGYIDDMKALGVNINDTSQASVEQEAALGRLKQMWTDLEIAIGQQLMPLMIDLFRFMHDVGLPALQEVGAAFKFVIDNVVWLATTIDEIARIISIPIGGIIDLLVELGIVAWDILTLNFKNILSDAQAGWEGMRREIKEQLDGISADEAAYKATHDALYGNKPKEEPTPNIYAKGGNKSYVDPAAAKKAAEEARKLADLTAQGEEKLALDKIKREEQMDAGLVSLGKTTNDELEGQQMALETRKFEIQQSFLLKKIAADKGNVLAEKKDQDQLEQLQITHETTLDKIHIDALQRRMALEKQETQEYIAEQSNRVTNGIAAIEQEYRQHLISYQERDQLEKNLTVTVYTQTLARLDAELLTLTKGTKAWEDAYKQRAKIAQDFAKEMQKLNTQTYNDENEKWKTLSANIRSSFNSALNGLLLGTLSWRQALGQVIDSIANSFLQMGEKIVEDWITTQIEKMIISKTTSVTSAESEIAANAAVAGSGAYAATAVIPFIGPELAPAAAATAYMGALSFGSLAVAEKGMVLDRDRLVSAHKEEMILPSNISNGLTNLIKNGGNTGGSPTLNYQPTVNGAKDKNLMDLLEEQGDDFLAWVQTKHRDGSLRLA